MDCIIIFVEVTAYNTYHRKIKAQRNRLLLSSPFSLDISLLRDGELRTLALGQRYPWLGALSDDEDVSDTGSECSVEGILDVNDIEVTDVLLSVHNDTSPAHVTTTGNHDDVSGIELDEVCDLASLELKFDSVIDLDQRVRITDGSSVVGDNVGDTASANSDFADLQKLVGSFFGGDAVNGETTLDVVKEAEVLAGFLERDNILETSRVGGVRANLSIDLHQTLHDDRSDLAASQGVF